MSAFDHDDVVPPARNGDLYVAVGVAARESAAAAMVEHGAPIDDDQGSRGGGDGDGAIGTGRRLDVQGEQVPGRRPAGGDVAVPGRHDALGPVEIARVGLDAPGRVPRADRGHAEYLL